MLRRHRFCFQAGAKEIALASALFAAISGCSLVASEIGSDLRGERFGKTYYLGGAGVLGHVGSISVPKGLRAGGYQGAISVVGWQNWFGGVLRDQIDRGRNEREAASFADEIIDYLDRYPGRRVNIIALSAGTGIAAWALERLPEEYHVGTVVFLGSSLSRRYDLGPALRRIDDKLFNFYSSDDPVLRYALPIAGSVDREFGGSVGGRFGFSAPRRADDDTRRLYLEKVRNMPPLRRYGRYGYEGGHTDGTEEAFVRNVIAPLFTNPTLKRAAAATEAHPPSTSAPAHAEVDSGAHAE